FVLLAALVALARGATSWAPQRYTTYPIKTGLANNSAQNIVKFTLPNSAMAAAVFRYHLRVGNGTDFQSEFGEFIIAGSNKAGTVSQTTGVVGKQQGLSTGTLTTTWALSF